MRKFRAIAILAFLSLWVAGPSFSQAVAYSGKLQIGFGDQDNATGFRSNNAMPICAGLGPAQNPGTVGTTAGTLLVNAQGTAVPGAGGALTFHAADLPTVGGAQEKQTGTCAVAIPGFANPRIRSRTQNGSAAWPAKKGPFTSMFTTLPVPATPTATYMLSLGNGNLQAVTSGTWTTMATPGAAANVFSGPHFSAGVPFLGAGLGVERFQPGAGRFGGGVPYSGGGNVQLGINFDTMTPGGATLIPGDYGLVSYANGFLPFGPQIFGTDAKGVNIVGQTTTSIYTSLFTYTAGIINGRQDHTIAARTPGGTTKDAHGAILTIGGGNTATPDGTFMLPIGSMTSITFDCVTMMPFGPCPQLISPVAVSGAFFEWTTGAVTHTDKVGDFTTIRKASGFDVAVGTASSVAGETRRLQVVSPWAATIRPVGAFGLPIPDLGFGGLSILSIDIIPVPEPRSLSMLGFGVAGLIGLGSVRNRRG